MKNESNNINKKMKMNNYAHYNDTYKRLLILARLQGAPEPKQIFKMAGIDVSNSQLHGWRAGPDHKNFRIINESEIISFVNGLINWTEKNDQK